MNAIDLRNTADLLDLLEAATNGGSVAFSPYGQGGHITASSSGMTGSHKAARETTINVAYDDMYVEVAFRMRFSDVQVLIGKIKTLYDAADACGWAKCASPQEVNCEDPHCWAHGERRSGRNDDE
jgi:hypothetical protein